ncbi:hypothetical protein IGI04_005297 [Brassica rapa subsp. trilocularis]|uniref:Uncharacterized protein n=1 Tax=Brassica rapa subsp. trilocularis TaxID=1813537 RepID=A0ABQ7NDK6_BRACM|nr:hypothetical protein IGI04_005297 [Brassica rapa subsp. trilocularis]
MAANNTKRRTIYRGKSQEKYEQTVDENSSFNEFEFWTNCRTLAFASSESTLAVLSLLCRSRLAVVGNEIRQKD